MSKPNGKPVDPPEGRAIQIESPQQRADRELKELKELNEARGAMRKTNVRKRGGVPINCARCDQLLAISYGDHLDCFAFTVWHRVLMKCEQCGGEKRWGPGKGTAFNEEINTEAPKIENAPLPKETEQTLDADKE